MKKYIIFLLALMVLFSCSNDSGGDIQTPKAGEARILARCIRRDSSREILVMKRIINVTAKYDSVERKYNVVIDTIWGYPISVLYTDSAGKVIIDSTTGKPKIKPDPQYYFYPKDSVEWRIENKDVDSLLKKR